MTQSIKQEILKKLPMPHFSDPHLPGSHNLHTLEPGIDVEQEINIGLGKVGK